MFLFVPWFYMAVLLTIKKKEERHLDKPSFDMLIRMIKVRWTYRVRNDEVLMRCKRK